MKDIINIEDLSKIYKLYDKPIDRLKESLSISKKSLHTQHYALKDVSFSVREGEILGIIGNNGAGKSTLLKIITGVLTPTNGTVNVNGTISALLELGTGFNPEYTGLENIYLYGTMINKSREQIDKEVDEIISFADIGEFINQPVKTYSSGMFARLAFSVAINVKPEILIVDEILSVGDQRFQIKCMKRMKEMMKGGTTVIYVAHDINAIKRFCTSVLWLDRGEVIEIGDVETVTDKYIDFLKIKDKKEQREQVEGNIEEFSVDKDCIAEIKSFCVRNMYDEEISEVRHNERITVEIAYNVYDESIDNPVLGVALKSIDGKQICGLNTLLDNIEIPWKKGRNIFSIEYPNGLLGIGGSYYFDVALFEETATVGIEYISRIKDIVIQSNHKGEGMYIIPHKWR